MFKVCKIVNNLSQNINKVFDVKVRFFKMTSNLKTKKLIAVCQLNCKEDKELNFNTNQELIKEAKNFGCSMVFLPEAFDMICFSKKATFQQAETLDGPLITKYRHLAKNLNIWLSLGGFHEKNVNKDFEKVHNTHLIINNKGEIASVYRKIHLFNLEIPGVVRLLESEFSIAGDRIVSPVSTPIGKIGLSICYDLRFPELSISLAKSGASVLTFPSAFTVPTGLAHWETLLRARAIENQCYVVAAAQVGIHNEKRSSYGHAMVIDPWGAVIAQCGDGVGLAIAIIDENFLKTCREKLPIWTDRKPNLYGEIHFAEENQVIDDCPEYQFGQVQIKSSQVFYKTRYSIAFVNHRPFLPGHSLVAIRRPSVSRLKDLSSLEIEDFFKTVQKVEFALEADTSASSSLIAIQDGEDAGRSIDQLHVHILPRQKNDYDSDLIYYALQKHDKDNSKLRTDQDMEQEAFRLRKYFY